MHTCGGALTLTLTYSSVIYVDNWADTVQQYSYERNVMKTTPLRQHLQPNIILGVKACLAARKAVYIHCTEKVCKGTRMLWYTVDVQYVF